MFNSTVTLFNYDEEANGYYFTLLENVEFQPSYQTSFENSSTNDEDSCLLVIRYFKEGVNKKVFGTKKIFKAPKEWSNMTPLDKEKHFTLRIGRDFFIKGDYTGTKDINYEGIKDTSDGVFFIHRVKDFEDELSHFEVVGY